MHFDTTVFICFFFEKILKISLSKKHLLNFLLNMYNKKSLFYFIREVHVCAFYNQNQKCLFFLRKSTELTILM